MTDKISRRTAKAKLSNLLKSLRGNAIAIATYTEALDQVGDWDSPGAAALRKHIIVLAGNHARVLGSQEATAGNWNKEEIWQNLVPTWRALEAHLPREKILEIKRHINGAFHSMTKRGGRYDDVIEAAIDEHGGIVDALAAMLPQPAKN